MRAFIFLSIILPSCFSVAMDFDDFNFISGLLHSGKISERMLCSIRARELKEERKFSDGTRLTEYIKVEFSTDHLGPRKINFAIAMNSNVKKQLKNYEDWGTVEELKVDLDDERGSTLTIIHTGDRIVYFELVNELSIYLCGRKLGT